MSKQAAISKKTLTRSLVNAEEITLLQTNTGGIILSVSDQLSGFTGLSVKDLVGAPLADIIGKKDQSKLAILLKEGVTRKKNITFSLIGKKGAHSVRFSIRPIDQSGKLGFLLNWNTSSGEPFNFSPGEDDLQALNRVFQFNPQPVIIYNADTLEVFYANPAASEFYGYKNTELAKLGLNDLFDNRLVDLHQSGNCVLTTKHKKQVDVFISSFELNAKTFQLLFSNVNKPTHTLSRPEAGHILDAEKALKNDYSDAWQMLDNAPEIFYKLDADGNFVFVSNEVERVLGYTKNEIQGEHFSSFILPEDLVIAKQGFADIFQFGRAKGNSIFRVMKKNGGHEWFSASGVFAYDDDGKPLHCIGVAQNITEIKKLVQKLRASEERYRSVVDALNEGIILQDNNGMIIACNKSATLMLGDDLVGTSFTIEEWRCIKENGEPCTYDDNPLAITLKTGRPQQGIIIGLQRPGNSFCWLSVNTEPIYYSGQVAMPDAVVASFFDITQRKQQEQWLSLEKDVLEINATPTATLKNTVDFYLTGIEKMFPDMVCSVLMLRHDKTTIQHLSSPSLPTEFSEAVNGLQIGPRKGSCGTAFYTKQRVITSDINTDPAWEGYRMVTTRFGMHSCWSFPIINAQNEVLATIAAYHRYPKTPTIKELNMMEVACNLLRIILENKKAEADLRLSNERYFLATKATHDAIYDWDFVQNTIYRGESFYSLFGYSRNEVRNLIDFLEEKLHPEDKSRVVKSLKHFIENKSPDIWETEYRLLKANGKYVVVYDRGFLIFNPEGHISRLVGSMMDITERKELEKRLLKQEINKQKQVAQAVVNAQEKERAEIGKELHDNVNQILSTARLYLELAKNDENERISLINRSYDNIYEAINVIRNISRSLVPPSIGDLGLVESVEDLVENIRATKKLYIEFYYGGDIDGLLGQKQKLMLFRIIQEQVNNVLKHANASNIIIELVIDGNMINLAVSDNGKGFDFEDIKNNKGVGLQNIASRTELFNGKINIVTAPDKGCKLNIHVPISKL